MSSLGFVVLARRPGQPAEPVSAVFPAYPNGLEQAQNAREGATVRANRPVCRKDVCDDCIDIRECGWVEPFEPGPVEYVIGEIAERTP